MSNTPTSATAAPNSSGCWVRQAPTSSPPLDPPLIAMRSALDQPRSNGTPDRGKSHLSVSRERFTSRAGTLARYACVRSFWAVTQAAVSGLALSSSHR